MDKSILLFVILLSPQLTMISNLTDVLKSTKKAKRPTRGMMKIRKNRG